MSERESNIQKSQSSFNTIDLESLQQKLAETTGVPSAVVSRVITTMLDEGWVIKPPAQPITVAEAAQKYHRSLVAIYTWIKRGRLGVIGRADNSALLIDELDVARLAEGPGKPGRPKKNLI